MSALRFNEGKPKLAYILEFPKAIEAVARVMEFGAAKYEDGNWKKGGKPDSEYLHCMMRHLTKWFSGQKYDKDSGCSHLAMAIWNFMAMHELNHSDEIVDEKLFKEKCEHWVKEKSISTEGQNLSDMTPAEWQAETETKFDLDALNVDAVFASNDEDRSAAFKELKAYVDERVSEERVISVIRNAMRRAGFKSFGGSR